MKRILEKSAASNEKLEIIYMDKEGMISQRTIKVFDVSAEILHAYCYNKKEYRTFTMNNILAIAPMRQRRDYVS